MKIIIIAGGFGSRLWPLSTKDRPKHFLSLYSNKTLIQETYTRAKKITNDVYVLTEQSQVKTLLKQLPSLKKDNIIIEPYRRGTSNCFLLGIQFIKNKFNDKCNDETIAFIAADHIVKNQNQFVKDFKLVDKISKQNKKIVLLGIKPTFPSTQMGYIETKKSNKNYFNVVSFKEKPNLLIATQYLNSNNFFWNSGYFIGSVNIFLKDIKTYSPSLFSRWQELEKAKNINNVYKHFIVNSIDYSLMEKDKTLLIYPAKFDWEDIGTIESLFKIFKKDINNNYILGKVNLIDVKNSFIINQTKYPLALIGLNDCTIMCNKDGILVTKTDKSTLVGEIAKMIYGIK